MHWKNTRTIAFIFWVMLVFVMIVTMPDLNKLVLEKGQITIPDTSQSQKGKELLNTLNTNGKSTYQFALVFHSEEPLTTVQMQEIDAKIAEINADAQKLNILDALTHIDSEQTARQLVAQNQTTVLAQFVIDKEFQTVEEVAATLRSYLQNLSMEAYVTGSDLVISDFAQSTQEGVKKTEIIAVIFIIVILIIIFRSPVVPMISLITVGVSYIVSLSIIALLVEHANLPFSNFTQVFLVVVLFGVGTDYNILLFTRFKEELAKQGHVLKAISTTYKTAGKTVIYSGLAVLVGFIALFLAEFSMYQATAAVSIGIAVLLAVLLTLNPFFMGIFGFKLFWPIKKVSGHGDNKLWRLLSRFAFFRPLISIFLVALVTIPFIWSYSNVLNYNDLVEIDDKYESKQAVRIIEQHYEAGFSSPVSLVVQSPSTLATQQMLTELDGLAAAIERVDGVARVYSVTRPEGARIDELYMEAQSGELKDGLTTAQGGVTEIHDGLTDAKQQVEQPQDLSGVEDLIRGTAQLSNGAQELQRALQTLTAGIEGGTAGASELQQNVVELQRGIQQLKAGLETLSTNYDQLAGGFSQYELLFTATASAINSAVNGYAQIEQLMTALLAQNPASVEANTALQIAQQAQLELARFKQQLTTSTAQYKELTAGFTVANEAIAQTATAAAQLEQGAHQLAAGAGSLQMGLSEAENGSRTIADNSSQFLTGLATVHAGQKTLQTSLEDLQQQMNKLANGLKETTDGLDDIHEGLGDANRYLADLNTSETGVFFIPQEVLEGQPFRDSLAMYMNDAHTISSMTIILDVNPYTEQAMQIVEELDAVVDSYVKSTQLAAGDVFLAGKTMQNVDLQQISQADFIRSAIVMMIGIMLILLWVTRSLFQTIIILATLFLTNFAALGLTELVTTHVLGHEALSWNVPFFTLIMIITLGVDYSIFFMMRYNETKALGLAQVIPAASEMGGVIVSAAIILGGTFAALIPSGIITLIQVAIAVMIGLLLLSIFVMPMLLPACFSLLAKVQHRTNKQIDESN